MSRSKKHEGDEGCEGRDIAISKSFFGGSSVLDYDKLKNIFAKSLWKERTVEIMGRTIIVSELTRKSIRNHLGDMEFALNEKGDPDGIKNHQEMVLTIASEIANELSEDLYAEMQRMLTEDDWLEELTNEILKEGKE